MIQENQLAAQLYTVRDFTKTPADIAASMKRIREIGYQSVQVSGMGPIDESELTAICDGEGLTICATHEPSQTILDEPMKVVERLQKLGCRFTAIPSAGGLDASSVASVEAYAARMDAAGKVLFDNDQILTYHNHDSEFCRVDGQMILEIFYDATNPQHLQGEIDTYWVQYGGGDPVDWCRRLSGRLPLIHLKDYIATPERKPNYCEVGYGNLNWPAIMTAAEDAGCEWYIVEQDTTPGDPFDSLKMSFDYLRENFCEQA